MSQDLLKPWGGGQGFKSGKGTQNPGRGQGHFRWGWKLQGVPASGLSFNKRGLEPRLPGHSGVRTWASAKGTRPPTSSAPTRLCGLRKATLPYVLCSPSYPSLATESLLSGPRACAPSYANALSLVVVPCHCPHGGENHGPANNHSPPLKDFWNIMTGIIHTYTVHSKGTVRAVNTSVLAVPHTSHGFLGFSFPPRPPGPGPDPPSPKDGLANMVGSGRDIRESSRATHCDPASSLPSRFSALPLRPRACRDGLGGVAPRTHRPWHCRNSREGSPPGTRTLRGKGLLVWETPECGRLIFQHMSSQAYTYICICLCGGGGRHNMGGHNINTPSHMLRKVYSSWFGIRDTFHKQKFQLFVLKMIPHK